MSGKYAGGAAATVPTQRVTRLSRTTTPGAGGTVADPKRAAIAKELLPYLRVLHQTKLFHGIDDQEIQQVVPCLDPRISHHEAGEYVLRPGEPTTQLRVVLAGEVHVIREDWDGNRNLVGAMGPGQTFADAYACSPSQVPQVAVVCEKPSTIMRLDVRKIITPCSQVCPFHARLMQNFVSQLADSTIRLSEKLRYLSQRTTREKLMAFFADCAQRAGSRTFELPYTRQELADFLSVNRSAMSGELSRMRDDGLVKFDRRRITLLGNFGL